MLELFDRHRKRIQLIQNAYDIVEYQVINSVSHLEFSLPDNDPKVADCTPFRMVRYGDGDLYRIMVDGQTVTENGHFRFRCEHVFATLIDDFIEGDVVVGNIGFFTEEVIQYVLKHQLTRHWVLGECDFARQFEYGWTDESLLGALHSVVNRFTEDYMWTFDTSSYPWVLNLKRLDSSIITEMYIRKRKNQLQLVKQSDATTVATRLYPRGDGEGVNTLTIKDVNNGIPYIESPPHIVAEYGIINRVWRDKRYTDPQSLLEAAEAMLYELQTPFESFEVDFAILGADELDTPRVGKVVEIVDFKRTFITEIEWHHDEIINSKLTIANKPRNVASAMANMADRMRVEQTYAQGATQIYADSISDNADTTTPATIRFRLPRNLALINEVVLTVTMSRFRAYGVATGLASAGAGAYTSANNPGLATTNQFLPDNGSNMTRTSLLPEHIWDRSLGHADGPGQPNHNHNIPRGTWLWAQVGPLPPLGDPIRMGQHATTVGFIPSGAHEHPAHGHGYNIPAHSHSFTIPNHTHQVDARISFLGFAQNFRIEINGQFITNPDTGGQWFTTADREFDLVPYLFDENNNLRRGMWYTVNIHPNDFARVEASYYVQGFVRSEGTRAV